MRKLRMLIVPFMFLVVLSGCAINRVYTQGKDFDANKRDQIVKGQSTKDDILKIFGEPNDKGIDDKYNEFWVYYYVESQNDFNMWTSSSKGSQHVKKIIIVFDHSKNNIVENFVYSDSRIPTSFK